MKWIKKFSVVYLGVLVVSMGVFLFPLFGLAQESESRNKFVPLVDLPYVNEAEAGIGGYMNAFYDLAIAAAALLVVIKLVLAGGKYILSDIVTNKEQAKKDIQGALFGLVIIVGAVLVLNEINPNLTNLNILRNAGELSGRPDDNRQPPSQSEQAQKEAEERGHGGQQTGVCDPGEELKCDTVGSCDCVTKIVEEPEPPPGLGDCGTNEQLFCSEGGGCSCKQIGSEDDDEFVFTASQCDIDDTNCQRQCEKVGTPRLVSSASPPYYECDFFDPTE